MIDRRHLQFGLPALLALSGIALLCCTAGCRKPPPPPQTAPPSAQVPSEPQADPLDRSNPLPADPPWVHSDKLEYRVGEPMQVQYDLGTGVKGKTWLGLIPTSVDAQDEPGNYSGAIQKTDLAAGDAGTGAVEFTTTQQGDFYLRLFGQDKSRATSCLSQTKIIVVHDWQQGNLVGPTKPYILLEGQEPLAELKPVPRITIKAGTTLKGVYELAEAYPTDAWIGVIPAEVGNRGGDASLPQRVWYKELSDGALTGTIEFTLDKPGEYYVRLFPCVNGNPTATFQSTRIIVE